MSSHLDLGRRAFLESCTTFELNLWPSSWTSWAYKKPAHLKEWPTHMVSYGFLQDAIKDKQLTAANCHRQEQRYLPSEKTFPGCTPRSPPTFGEDSTSALGSMVSGCLCTTQRLQWPRQNPLVEHHAQHCPGAPYRECPALCMYRCQCRTWRTWRWPHFHCRLSHFIKHQAPAGLFGGFPPLHTHHQPYSCRLYLHMDISLTGGIYHWLRADSSNMDFQLPSLSDHWGLWPG